MDTIYNFLIYWGYNYKIKYNAVLKDNLISFLNHMGEELREMRPFSITPVKKSSGSEVNLGNGPERPTDERPILKIGEFRVYDPFYDFLKLNLKEK